MYARGMDRTSALSWVCPALTEGEAYTRLGVYHVLADDADPDGVGPFVGRM